MVLPLPLPTTSPLPYPLYLQSPSHPSLPVAAKTHHLLLRAALKTHANFPASQRASHLPSILNALEAYLPYLFAINAGLALNGVVSGEEVDVVLKKEVEGDWGSMLMGSNIFGDVVKRSKTKRGRVSVRGMDAEVGMCLMVLAGVWRGLARESVRGLNYTTAGRGEERGKSVQGAMRYLLQANGVHAFLAAKICTDGATEDGADTAGLPEMMSSVQYALAEMAMAEATLLAVAKDDPYPAAVMQERDKQDREWMVGKVEIPKVRAHLFARLCIAAAEHAEKAVAMLRTSGKVNEDIIKYAAEVRKVARGRACRFFGIDEELGGETGRAIAWLRGARRELDVLEAEKGWAKGWGKVKKGFEEKREDRKAEKGGDCGGDAGRMEEVRVVEMLEKKWVKMNDTINTQLVPPFETLLASMPSGREIHSTTLYVPPELDADILEKMRAPPDPDEARALMADDEDSSDNDPSTDKIVPGTFPSNSAGNIGASEYY
ncbi:MAG: hypothetical protein Q9220_005979 [cf. Caloplaca sp. 1 TL-2023]